MKTYYKLTITETARDSMKDEPSLFNKETETFDTIDAVKAYLVERYGKMPSMKNKTYYDGPDGAAIEAGFTHSYWNRDVSHNSKSWYQTDWIDVFRIQSENVLLH